ncbi:hypothetical protein [Rhodopirellula sallentina]|uniref:Uncharacterized protein n=1 Tax=Rhodopirellula sallentina SM41 TaxID=1263870 RepID=M5TXX2_9BACT|nr:hypothetical protein [Rhodopirellula sallentina]EMI54072.1 hypothetical protein RSSM_04487 [Rhodopirellula sallentina SM41]
MDSDESRESVNLFLLDYCGRGRMGVITNVIREAAKISTYQKRFFGRVITFLNDRHQSPDAGQK